MSKPPDQSVDLWTRLARVGFRCHTEIEAVQGSPPVPGSRQWQVTIRLRGIPTGGPYISVVRARAVDAIAQAVQEAEALGWHVPAQV